MGIGPLPEFRDMISRASSTHLITIARSSFVAFWPIHEEIPKWENTTDISDAFIWSELQGILNIEIIGSNLSSQQRNIIGDDSSPGRAVTLNDRSMFDITCSCYREMASCPSQPNQSWFAFLTKERKSKYFLAMLKCRAYKIIQRENYNALLKILHVLRCEIVTKRCRGIQWNRLRSAVAAAPGFPNFTDRPQPL